MKNITVTMEEELARWARVRAAYEMKSLSRYLAGLLEAERRRESGQAPALTPVERFLAAGQKLGVEKVDRDSLYDRQSLR